MRLRLLIPADNAWPALPNEAGSQVWSAYRQAERTQWLSAGDIEAGQLEQLRWLLAHAVVHVTHYRRVLPGSGIVPGRIRDRAAFMNVPRLNRQVIHAQPLDFASRELPAGMQSTGKLALGVAGEPGAKLRKTNLSDVWACAIFLRDLDWCGLDPSGVVALVIPTFAKGEELRKRMEGIVTPCLYPPVQDLIEMGPCHIMDMRQEPARQIDWLARIGASALITFPSNLERLARLTNSLAGVRTIQAIGESLESTSQSRLEAVFGVPVRGNYSCKEAGLLASPCPDGRGWHVHAETVLLEVLDETGAACAPGMTGQVHVTTLHNYQTPLLRYELPDKACAGEGACPCGRGLPWLTDIRSAAR